VLLGETMSLPSTEPVVADEETSTVTETTAGTAAVEKKEKKEEGSTVCVRERSSGVASRRSWQYKA
jgi:hypothetical protein